MIKTLGKYKDTNFSNIEICSSGKVYTKERYIKHWKGGLSLRPRKELKTQINEKGYHSVTFQDDNKIKYSFKLHRLVAFCFVDNPDNKPEVDHKNDNKNDNSYTNLQWCTRLENMQMASKSGLLKGSNGNLQGEKHPSTNLSEQQVIEIKTALKAGKFGIKAKLARKYNVNPWVIWDIAKGKKLESCKSIKH